MEFKNPLAFPTIDSLLYAVLNVVVVIATPLVVFFIIYAGFMYVTARGNPEQIKKASQALTYGVIGGVVIAGSAAIMTIVSNVATSF